MIVVSNTSPINYLILIDHIDLLPKLFQQIIIPVGAISSFDLQGLKLRATFQDKLKHRSHFFL